MALPAPTFPARVLLAGTLLACVALATGDEEPARPASAPEGDPVAVRLRYPAGCAQAAHLSLRARFDSAALGLSFALEASADGRLEAKDDAHVELTLRVDRCTLNGADLPQGAGLEPVVRARLDGHGRWEPGSLRVEGLPDAASALAATWCEAMLVHLPETDVRVGEVWDLPLAAPVAGVPLPPGATFDLTGWQRLLRPLELDAGFTGSVGDLPVRLPVNRVRTTLDASLEGEGATVLGADGTLRRLRLTGRARMDVANPAGGDPLQARSSCTLELVLDPPAQGEDPPPEDGEDTEDPEDAGGGK